MYNFFVTLIGMGQTAIGSLGDFAQAFFEPIQLGQFFYDTFPFLSSAFDFINNNVFGSLSYAQLFLGAGITIYIGFQLVKWVIDVLP